MTQRSRANVATFAMMRQFLGGRADGLAPDPDAAAAMFESIEPMRAMFDGMKADQDAGQGRGRWRDYLRLSWQRTRHPGYTYADFAGRCAGVPARSRPRHPTIGDRRHHRVFHRHPAAG